MTISLYKGVYVSDASLHPDIEKLDHLNDKLLADRTSAVDPNTQRHLYVTKGAMAADADGSITRPYATIAAANAAVGNATDDAEWADASQQFWVIQIGPGVWAEDITNVPFRPWVRYIVEGELAPVGGSWTATHPQNVVETGMGAPQLIFEGAGLRAGWDGTAQHMQNGIRGDLNFDSNGQVTANWFPQIHLIRFGVSGNVNLKTTAGTANIAARYDEAFIGGQTIRTGGGSCNIWAQGAIGNETVGDVEGIGGFSGNLTLFALSNVLISGDCDHTGGLSGARWYDVRILDAATVDFSGGAAATEMDQTSWREYINGTSLAERFSTTPTMLGGASKYSCGNGGIFPTMQDMVDEMETEADATVGFLFPGLAAEDVSVSKGGVAIRGGGLGDYYQGDDSTVLPGDLTLSVAAAKEINEFSDFAILGTLKVEGANDNLVYLNNLRVQAAAGNALEGTNSHGTTRYIASGCYFESQDGVSAAVKLTGAVTFDGQRGVNEFVGTDAAGVCIDINAGGDGFVGVNQRIGGTAKVVGAAGFTLTGAGSNIIAPGEACVDRSGGTGGAVVYMVGVALLATGDVVLNPGGDAAKFSHANCLVLAGTLDDTVGTQLQVDGGPVELGYTPAITGDWTGADPTKIWQALDRIAAALGPIA
jgi:hypothetical protein